MFLLQNIDFFHTEAILTQMHTLCKGKTPINTLANKYTCLNCTTILHGFIGKQCNITFFIRFVQSCPVDDLGCLPQGIAMEIDGWAVSV